LRMISASAGVASILSMEVSEAHGTGLRRDANVKQSGQAVSADL
jgi:hypothetical protein